MATKTEALVLIDLQVDIFRGRGGGRQAHADHSLDKLCERLEAYARSWIDAGKPLLIIQHAGGPSHRLALGSGGWRIRPELANLPAIIVAKESSDGFFKTELKGELQRLGVGRLTIGGCMTEYCVDTTCRSAVAHGYDVTLLADGHLTVDGVITAEKIVAHHNAVLDGFNAGDHRISIDNMRTSESKFAPGHS